MIQRKDEKDLFRFFQIYLCAIIQHYLLNTVIKLNSGMLLFKISENDRVGGRIRISNSVYGLIVMNTGSISPANIWTSPQICESI